jgi:hypothetical protein
MAPQTGSFGLSFEPLKEGGICRVRGIGDSLGISLSDQRRVHEHIVYEDVLLPAHK